MTPSKCEPENRPHWLFLAALAFCILEVIGGVVLSTLLVLNGTVVALTSLTAGIAVSLGLWWWTADEGGKGIMHSMARVAFVATAGLAFYTILTYVLWASGIPLDLGVVQAGRMGEHYWLGPFTLAYSVVAYIVLKQRR